MYYLIKTELGLCLFPKQLQQSKNIIEAQTVRKSHTACYKNL